MAHSHTPSTPPATALWCVDTTSAELVNIWVCFSCALFLALRADLPHTVVDAHLIKAAPLGAWTLFFAFTGLAHSASLWSRADWLRYICCGVELMGWSYIVAALVLAGDPTPSRAHYLALAIVNFWVLIRGPGGVPRG